ncbi:MAG: flippase-like domain-containing protein [Sediminimonas qiaohouensis]|uniref:Flippase-like domain-containing protein n=1 Tax=Sediminimonas qiaohouensis TaxID=552061 RepID=A0A7C9M6W0_9RHOB|nr:lysylphosphatidylglycerol synthase transmembrane domain-containing protein [Sediminimonas qiaohouensis]MTJ03261.1 flippase-like domain-containing protein [Sediminimonas qiaohouensis]
MTHGTPDITTPPPARPIARWRDLALMAGLVVLVAAGLISAAAATGWEQTMTQLSRLGMLQIAALLGLSCVNYGLRGLRWHLFARRLGLPTSLARNLTHFWGGFAMVVTPGRVGEVIRMRWIKRETGWNVERTAPLVLIDRASDLVAMGLLLGLSVALSSASVAMALPVAMLALIGAFVVTRPQLLSGLASGVYRVTGRFARLMGRLRAAARSLGRFSHPWVLLAATGLGLIGWLSEGWAFHLLMGWMGHDIGLWKATLIFVFSTLAGGLTGAPGGLGGAEGAMVALLLVEGVPIETALPATAVIRVTTLWFAIAIGFTTFPIAERNSLKGSQ